MGLFGNIWKEKDTSVNEATVSEEVVEEGCDNKSSDCEEKKAEEEAPAEEESVKEAVDEEKLDMYKTIYEFCEENNIELTDKARKELIESGIFDEEINARREFLTQVYDFLKENKVELTESAVEQFLEAGVVEKQEEPVAEEDEEEEGVSENAVYTGILEFCHNNEISLDENAMANLKEKYLSK